MDPRLAKLQGSPTLAEMTPLAFNQLPEMAQRQGLATTADAARYGMRWFRHEDTGLVFLGLVQPDASEHSRWIVCANPDQQHVWYGVVAEGSSHPRARRIGGLRMYSDSPREGFLGDYVSMLQTSYDMLVHRARKQVLPTLTRELMVVHSRIIPDTSLNHAVAALRYDPAYLHGILHHYDAWVLENPDFAEVPRDIVMRTHGLEFYTQYRYV